MNPLKSLFFAETLRRWHFEVILKESGLSRERVYHFLKELQKEDFIKRIKPKGKMPYYLAHRESHKFRIEKRMYGLKILENLFSHISECKNIKTAILFGSFANGNWNKSSDIDLFLYGKDNEFNKAKFELELGRDIQLFSYKNQQKIILEPAVISNIIKGFHITQSIEPFEVKMHA
ncbi:nucleotidyltransferase domain-containing protein [Candidatus Woesearchaeota archaeon]|nr:nucleotidyltransferase domain-containing protein [Candidatus Woesearchaeota archaeon]